MAKVGVPASSMSTRIQLCGRFLALLRGEEITARLPGRQGRLLLAFLAVRPYRAASRDELMDAIWPGAVPSAPDMALSALLSKLRRVLGEDALEGRSDVMLHLPEDAFVDVERARLSIHRAESLVSAERWWDAYTPSVTARYIAERRFLRGEDAPWTEEIRRELAEIHLRALECDIRVGLAVRSHEQPIAVRSARRLVQLAPYRESAYCLLMEALQQEGNKAEAMRVFEDLRHRLREDLGTAPGHEALAIHARLLA